MENLLKHINEKQPDLTHRGSKVGLYNLLKTYPKELETTPPGDLALIHRAWLLWLAVWTKHELQEKWKFDQSETANLAKLMMELVKPKAMMGYSPLIWDLINAGQMLTNPIKSEEFIWFDVIADLQDCDPVPKKEIISLINGMNQCEMMLLAFNMVSNYTLFRELRLVMLKEHS